MSKIVFGGIAPHGFSLIEEIAGTEYELFKPLREQMIEWGKKVSSLEVDTIILLTPHGLRLKGYNAIYLSENCRGSLSQFGKSVSLDYKCDVELANQILAGARKVGIPSVGCNFGALSGPASNIEMDWGTLIPLWFMRQKDQPKLVVINPTRDIPREQLVQLGEIIHEKVKQSHKKVAIIASADQGHCHDASGPYGYHPKSKEYDELMCEIVKHNELEKLLSIDQQLIDDSKPDSLWQMLILYGAIKNLNFNVHFMKYQVPTYFGMLIARFEK